MEVGIVPDNWELQLKIYRNCFSLHTKEPEIIENMPHLTLLFSRGPTVEVPKSNTICAPSQCLVAALPL
ncbi:hypothetical protein Lser_V15G29951 [Lactuca serriola]